MQIRDSKDYRDCSDRHIYEQAPAPVCILGERATGDQTNSGSATRDCAVHTEGTCAFLGNGEGNVDKREC